MWAEYLILVGHRHFRSVVQDMGHLATSLVMLFLASRSWNHAAVEPSVHMCALHSTDTMIQRRLSVFVWLRTNVKPFRLFLTSIQVRRVLILRASTLIYHNASLLSCEHVCEMHSPRVVQHRYSFIVSAYPVVLLLAMKALGSSVSSCVKGRAHLVKQWIRRCKRRSRVQKPVDLMWTSGMKVPRRDRARSFNHLENLKVT